MFINGGDYALQKCGKCTAKFSWSKIYKSFWWTYKPIECNECGTIHKITMPGRIIFTSLTTIPMLLVGHLLINYYNIYNIFMTIGIALFVGMIGSLFTPFFVTYKKFL